MVEKQEPDEERSKVKFSIGIGGGNDDFGGDHDSAGLNIETPPVKFMTTGQKLVIVLGVIVVAIIAYLKFTSDL